MKPLISAAAIALALIAPAGAQAPLPPPRPGVTEVKSQGAAQMQPAPQRSNAEIVALANAYLNGVNTMIAEFTQVAGDGRRAEGTLSVQKPGRMRFEYNPPATIEVIADGTSLAIRDRKLRTQDLYALWQTPLKFLLKERIDLARDTKILQVEQNPNAAILFIEDKATLGGTSRIRLVFDPQTFQLKQWTVTDPQGFDTIVTLFNVDLATRPDPAGFRINTERMLNTTRNN